MPKSPQQIITEKRDLFNRINFKALVDSNIPYFFDKLSSNNNKEILTRLPNNKRLFIRVNNNDNNSISTYTMSNESNFDYKLDDNWNLKSTVNYVTTLGLSNPSINGILISAEFIRDDKKYIYTPSIIDRTKKNPSVLIIDNDGNLQIRNLLFTGDNDVNYPDRSYMTFYGYKNNRFVCGFNNLNQNYLHIFTSTDGINFNFFKKENISNLTINSIRQMDDYIILNMAYGLSSFATWKVLLNDNIDIQKNNISTSDPYFVKYYNNAPFIKYKDMYYFNYRNEIYLTTKDFENYTPYEVPTLFKNKIKYSYDNKIDYLQSLNIFMLTAESVIDNKRHNFIFDDILNPTYLESIDNPGDNFYYNSYRDVGIGKIVAVSASTYKYHLTEFNPSDFE